MPKQKGKIINELDMKILTEAATILRTLSRYHNDAYQRTRDSQSEIELHKGRMAMERAVQLDRMANEVDMVAQTDGFKDG